MSGSTSGTVASRRKTWKTWARSGTFQKAATHSDSDAAGDGSSAASTWRTPLSLGSNPRFVGRTRSSM